MSETIKNNSKKIASEPSEMFYEINRLADRADKEVIAIADKVETEKMLIMENALISISKTKKELNEEFEKSLPKQLKPIEEKLDFLVEEMEEEIEEEEEKNKSFWKRMWEKLL